MCAAATSRGELVALIDVLDMLDVASAEAAGIDLDRVLLDSRTCRAQSRAVPRREPARARPGHQSADAGAAVRQSSGSWCSTPARRRPTRSAAAVYNLAAPAAHHRRQPDGVRARRAEPIARSSAGLTLQLGAGMLAEAVAGRLRRIEPRGARGARALVWRIVTSPANMFACLYRPPVDGHDDDHRMTIAEIAENLSVRTALRMPKTLRISACSAR